MKKLLVFILMFSVFCMMFGVSGVLADQTVIVDGPNVIDFTIEDLNFGSVTPGATATTTADFILNPANNVDLGLDVCLDDAAEPLFEAIELDMTNLGATTTEDLQKCAVASIAVSVTDADADQVATEQTFEMGGSLDIPLGLQPGQRQATITYTITGPV